MTTDLLTAEDSICTMTHEIESKYVLPAHKIKIKCGASVYSKWKAEKLHYMVPDGDVEFEVDFVDTRPGETSLPVAVITHGAPGDYTTFEYLIKFLDDRQVRVIAPNFPTCPNFKPPNFRHSSEEKRCYFETFLNRLNIKTIDILIAHSSSVYFLFEIILKQKYKIKSVAFINPGGFKIMKSLKPFWIIQFGDFMTQFPGGYSFISTASNFLLNRMNSPLDRNCVDGVILSGITMNNSGFLKSEELFKQYGKLGIPTFLAWSKNDKLVDQDISEKIAQAFGVNEENYWYYNNDGLLEQKGEEENNVTAQCFNTSSHFLFSSKYKDVIAKEAYSLLLKVWNTNEKTQD